MRLYFLFAAACAFVACDKLSLFNVKLLFGDDFPFVKATAAEGFSLVFLGGGGAFERQDVGHQESAG